MKRKKSTGEEPQHAIHLIDRLFRFDFPAQQQQRIHSIEIPLHYSTSTRRGCECSLSVVRRLLSLSRCQVEDEFRIAAETYNEISSRGCSNCRQRPTTDELPKEEETPTQQTSSSRRRRAALQANQLATQLEKDKRRPFTTCKKRLTFRWMLRLPRNSSFNCCSSHHFHLHPHLEGSSFNFLLPPLP